MKRAVTHFLKCVCVGLMCGYVLTIQAAHAQPDKKSDAGYLFYKANTHYEKGSYDEAIAEYSRLLEQGIESGNLYYNLGNCYFKTGDLGKAILSYERARRLIPRDSDLKSNYAFAKSQIRADNTEASLPLAERAAGALSFLSVNEMTVLLSGLFVISIIFLTARLFFPLSKNTFILTLICIVIASGFISFSLAVRIAAIDREAIVVSEKTEVRFEPFESSTEHFTLHEGMKIYLIQFRKEWIKVKRADGKTGWVQAVAIEKI